MALKRRNWTFFHILQIGEVRFNLFILLSLLNRTYRWILRHFVKNYILLLFHDNDHFFFLKKALGSEHARVFPNLNSILGIPLFLIILYFIHNRMCLDYNDSGDKDLNHIWGIGSLSCSWIEVFLFLIWKIHYNMKHVASECSICRRVTASNG